ncbi:hypothetical protein EfmGK923_29730 (plasmid) [Enterococcus faecium]|nr:hypothetical protein EfmGK923_29730 [Enterococcus faecium]
MNHFKGKQFQQDVIIVAVGYYLRYNLSYREVQEILYDRDINVSHTTIYRWVQIYGNLSLYFPILYFMFSSIILRLARGVLSSWDAPLKSIEPSMHILKFLYF